MIEKNYSPILITTFNRPDLLSKLIDSIKLNEEHKSSDLYIFSDNWKYHRDKENVQKVRNYIDKVEGFKSINIIKRKTNFTMAINVIDAIAHVFNKHKSLIFLEEDLVVSSSFLEYMNKALLFYSNNSKVMHVSGYKYPFEVKNKTKNYYFSRLPNTWGYGIWRHKIDKFHRDHNYFIDKMSKKDIYELDFHNNSYFWKQLLQNKKGINHTFAIFWYLIIFLNNGLCLYPIESLVLNKGVDGRGSNIKDKTTQYDVNLSNKLIFQFENKVNEDMEVFSQMKKYFKAHKESILDRISRRLKVFFKAI